MKKAILKTWDFLVDLAAVIFAALVAVVIFLISFAWIVGIPIIVFLVIAKLLGWI